MPFEATPKFDPAAVPLDITSLLQSWLKAAPTSSAIQYNPTYALAAKFSLAAELAAFEPVPYIRPLALFPIGDLYEVTPPLEDIAMSPQEIRDTFNRAADLIERRGHAKGTFFEGSKLCMFAAVALGTDPALADVEDYDVLLHRTVPSRKAQMLTNTPKFLQAVSQHHVCGFNNQSTTTQQIAVDTLRKVANAF